MSNGEMTEKQIENWRRALLRIIGPFALIMPVELIVAFRDRMQEHANSLDVVDDDAIEETPACKCDPNRQGYTRHLDGRVTCNKCKLERV